MNNTQKLQVATDAPARIAREPGCGCDFPCRRNGEEWERINTEGLRDIADTALAILAAPSTEQPTATAGDSSVTLRDEVAIAAEMWANAEYAEAKNLGAGGSSDGEACAAAEDKFRKLLDKLVTERAATQPAGLTEDELHEMWNCALNGHALNETKPHHVASFIRAIIARLAAPISEDAGEVHYKDSESSEVWQEVARRVRADLQPALDIMNAPASPSGSTEQPAAASADVDDTQFHDLLGDYTEAFTVGAQVQRERLITHINAWGAQQRGAGRRDAHETNVSLLSDSLKYEARAEAAEKERDDLRAQLAEWEKLKDPAALHINLLRGMPARLEPDQLRHIAGDFSDAAQLARPADLAGLEPKHPMQPVMIDSVGTLRFKENAIVRFLATDRLNELACMEFSDADREQLVQLIGYSVSGTSNFEFVSDEVYGAAQAAGEILLANATPRMVDHGEGAIPDPRG